MTKKELYEKSLEIADQKKLIYIEEILNYLPVSKATFYLKFPKGSDELDAIKRQIEKNKIDIKVSQRQKWYMSDNPSLQIALYKLGATEDELNRLNNREKVAGEEMPKIEIKLNGINEKTK